MHIDTPDLVERDAVGFRDADAKPTADPLSVDENVTFALCPIDDLHGRHFPFRRFALIVRPNVDGF